MAYMANNTVYLSTSDLTPLENNPRKIDSTGLAQLEASMAKNGFWEHRPIAVVVKGDKNVVLAGNQRLRVAKKLHLKKVPVIIYQNLTEEEEKEIILRDNINNGEWDFMALSTEEWDDVNFDDIGLDFERQEPGEADKKEKKAKEGTAKKNTDVDDDGSDNGDDDENEEPKPLVLDILFESDNDYEIPNLLPNMQAGKVELPITPWGANSRLRKDVATYHFYVDDYRFEQLWKDPANLIASGCKAIVEPNCSLHDQTPIAYGLQLIYKKRWLARYMQECGMFVYVDLNVSKKFVEFNKLGVPKGWNAFFTRGLTGMVKGLESDLRVAQEISGLETPNLVVYGGGNDIRKFCQKHGILYLTDFINAK